MSAKMNLLFAESQKRNRNIIVFALLAVIVSRLLFVAVYAVFTVQSGSEFSFFNDLNFWDAGWYKHIIQNGYCLEPFGDEGGDAANWAFFPLLPMIVGFFHKLTGLEIYLVASTISTLFLAALIVITFHYIMETRESVGEAVGVSMVLSFGPYSLYFSMLYTESLYLLLLMLVLYFLQKEKYLAMGIAGALLSGTRNTGVMVVFAVGVKVLADYCMSAKEQKGVLDFIKVTFRNWKLVLGVCLIPLGLFAFMAYLGWKMGDPLAFLHVQVAWGGEIGNPLAVLWRGLRSSSWREIYLAACGMAGILIAGYLVIQKRFHEAVLAMILLMIPLSVRLQSIPRYLIGSGVFVLGGADILRKLNSKILIGLVLTCSIVFEFICLWYWFKESIWMI